MSILAALDKTRRAFREVNMEPPGVTLARHDDGMALLAELQHGSYVLPPVAAQPDYFGPRTSIAVSPPMPIISDRATTAADVVPFTRLDLPHGGKLVWVKQADDGEYDPYMEIEVFGMKVRWPAKRMALRGGASIWY